MSKSITITIKRGVKVEAHGYTGAGCKDAIRTYEKLLRAKRVSEEAKPEMYETATEDTEQSR